MAVILPVVPRPSFEGPGRSTVCLHGGRCTSFHALREKSSRWEKFGYGHDESSISAAAVVASSYLTASS